MTTQAEQQAQEAQGRAEIIAAIQHRLEARETAKRVANADLAMLVAEARRAGCTWSLIAEAMAMTPNGVRHFIRQHE